MTQINPYLNFNGTCEKAFDFYQSVFGGEPELSRFSEMPAEEWATPVDGDLIMHVSLPIGDGQILMGSDRPPSMGTVDVGNNVNVMINPSSSEDGKRIFDALTEGGQVTMPYERTFWGADFGSLTDQFGIQWMVNYAVDQEG